jgi:hypothetical protein
MPDEVTTEGIKKQETDDFPFTGFLYILRIKYSGTYSGISGHFR